MTRSNSINLSEARHFLGSAKQNSSLVCFSPTSTPSKKINIHSVCHMGKEENKTLVVQRRRMEKQSLIEEVVPMEEAARPWPRVLPSLEAKDNNNNNGTDAVPTIDPAHHAPLGSWTSEQLNASRQAHPFLMTWIPGKSRHSVPNLTHGQGVYVYDDSGKQYLDWTSQAVCANLGHTLPDTVIQAATYQLTTLPFVYSGIGVTEVRIRLHQLVAELLSGTHLRAAVFPSAGAEANEAGIILARRYTQRPKILSFYRSYHGATGQASAVTGDMRRWYNTTANTNNVIHAFSPFPLFFQYHGHDETERVQSALALLEEQILNEGPELIASIVMESIVGAGGCLVAPPGYMAGVRAICDKYGILLHFDEVMVGFGRTGKWFGFQHYGVLPDIVTAAKGLSAAAMPLSMMACRTEIMQAMEEQPLGWGSTYQAHPVAMATAYEVLKHMVQTDLVGHVQRQLAPVFREEMQRLAQQHACIKQYRAIGLLGCFDVHDSQGHNPKLQHEVAHEAFWKYKEAFKDNGLVGLHRYPHIHCAPPLVITEEELRDGFQRLDRALTVLDEALGFLDTAPEDSASYVTTTASSSSSTVSSECSTGG